MIKKISNFIVNKRIVILAAMLILVAISIICSQFVEINEDMTKYLPDDSNMKAGLDIMEAEFPEMETSNTIRVMFDDLTDTGKKTVLEELGAITYVDSVDYDAESRDYNKDNHTVFVLNMSCDYGSDEEAAIETALRSQFAEYTMVWKNDDSGFPPIPMALIVTALAILLTVLFIMCGSWIEPLLFLVVIGVAVVINGGTNLILGSVASITNSIAAILQLVLSMDYSIILMNRYRQEKALESDSKQAMKNALASSFSSVASSSFTTVIGLLMLVFMSFKIGANLGIVLAKGVFISMVCVLSMLPGIILACDKLIQKTAKKALNIPTEWAAKFSYKMRFCLVVVFAMLFVGAFILQRQTGISYTLAEEDEIADIFPKSNTVVMVYENQDEDQMEELIADLEKDENVKSILGYGTILGKPYTSGELAEALGEISEDISLNSGMIDMLYYDYYNNGKIGTMTAAEFFSFISDTVINDETFSAYIDDDMKEKVKMLDKFADAGALTLPMTADELADFFGIDADTVELLFVYYHASLDDFDPGTMTLPEFVSFLQNDIANDPAFSSYLDESTMEQAGTLASFTDKKALQTQRSAAELSSIFGMDESLVKTIFILHHAQDVSHQTMTLAQFTAFLNSGLLADPMFGSSFDGATRAQLKTMDTLIQLAAARQEIAAAQMAQALGMDATAIHRLYFLYFSQNVDFQQEIARLTMPLPDFLTLLKADATDEQQAQLAQMEQLITLASSGQKLDAAALTQITGVDEAQISRVFASQDPAVDQMTLPEFLNTALQLSPGNAQLNQLNRMVQMTISETPLNAEALAQMFGMQDSQVKKLFGLTLASQKPVSFPDFTSFLVNNVLSNEAYAGSFTEDQKAQLTTMNQMAQLAASGTGLDAGTLAQTFGMEKDMIEMVFRLYYGSDISGTTMSMKEAVDFILADPVMKNYMDNTRIGQVRMMQQMIKASENESDDWTLSAEGFIDFILDDVLSDDTFADRIDADTSDMLSSAREMVNAVISGNPYSASEMGELLDGLTENMDSSMIELMYLYAESSQNADPKWTMTMETLLGYMTEDVLNDPRFASVLDDDMRQKLLEAQDSLEEGKKQLVEEKYSRLVITTAYPDEGAETTAFFADLEQFGNDKMKGEYYLVGNSAMSYEMQKTFDHELLFITLLTALAIFLIVAITFKSISIPLILVLLVQCGVYITITITGVLNGSIYYLALLVVECILMGSTVDYGILLTNYYCEARKTANVKDALKAAYSGSIHTIMTSGMILILVTAAVGGMFHNPTVNAIIKTISMGALCATILILFVLPGVLAACDKIVTKKRNRV